MVQSLNTTSGHIQVVIIQTILFAELGVSDTYSFRLIQTQLVVDLKSFLLLEIASLEMDIVLGFDMARQKLSTASTHQQTSTLL